MGYAQYFALFGYGWSYGSGSGISFETADASIQVNGAVGTHLGEISTVGTLTQTGGSSFTRSITTSQVRADIIGAMRNGSDRLEEAWPVDFSLGGLHLYPGVYKVGDNVYLGEGETLILDGDSIADARWIILVPHGGLLNGDVEIVNLPGYTAGGSSPVPVWWVFYEYGEVEIGSNAVMVGHMLAKGSIRVKSSGSFMGSLLSVVNVYIDNVSGSTLVVQAFNYPNNFKGIEGGYTGTFFLNLFDFSGF
jgi:hypothetical protein